MGTCRGHECQCRSSFNPTALTPPFRFPIDFEKTSPNPSLSALETDPSSLLKRSRDGRLSWLERYLGLAIRRRILAQLARKCTAWKSSEERARPGKSHDLPNGRAAPTLRQDLAGLKMHAGPAATLCCAQKGHRNETGPAPDLISPPRLLHQPHVPRPGRWSIHPPAFPRTPQRFSSGAKNGPTEVTTKEIRQSRSRQLEMRPTGHHRPQLTGQNPP